MQKAYDRHVGPGFRHHNAWFRGDADSLRAPMEDNAVASPGKVLEVKRSLQDGDLVAAFSHVRRRADEPGAAVAHIFRFEGDRVVELRDAARDVPEVPVNEYGPF